MTLQIESLHIYPVKSLAGLAVRQSDADIRGLADDRRWMLIDDNARFISQRQLPALATLRTALTDSELIISQGETRIAIQRGERQGTPAQARIWSDTVAVVEPHPAVSEFLADCLPGAPRLRLVQLAARRPQSKPQYLGRETHTVFADMAPLLVTNSASLDALNEALQARGEAPVPMNRFRPNVVVSGLKPFAEHRLKGLQAGQYQLRFAYPCERCVMTTVDQATGIKHPAMEPYMTLRDLNSMPAYGDGEFAKPANPKAPAFGENALLQSPATACLRVGDSLRVL